MNLHPAEQWSWAFYHAAGQLLAVSPGVVPPVLVGEIFIYLVSMVVGAVLYAIFVATVTAMLTDVDPSAREYRSKVDMMNQYMRHAQLPRYLRTKMRTYYQLRFPGHRAFDEERILSELSGPLTHEVRSPTYPAHLHGSSPGTIVPLTACSHLWQVRLQKCRNVLTALNILEGEDPQVAYYLCDKLNRVVYNAGDYVIREGQEAVGMFFISTGLVEVISKRTGDEPLTTLGSHSFFGEMALLNPKGEATASVVVRTYLDGYLLTKADYTWLERHHPVFRDYLLSAAKLRMKRLQAKLVGVDDPTHGTADLHPLYEVLDPVKRRLQKARVRMTARHIVGTPRQGKGNAPMSTTTTGAAAATGVRRRSAASVVDAVRDASLVLAPDTKTAEHQRLMALPEGAITDPVFAPPTPSHSRAGASPGKRPPGPQIV